MQAAAWGMLLLLLLLSMVMGETQQSIKCVAETGPPIDWTRMHNYTPSDIYNLSVKIVTQETSKFNISWVLQEDASIQFLNATRLCVITSGYPACVRCDYTEKFQSQTMSNHEKWQFFYVGFHVEENTFYRIYASNLPSANLDEDPPMKHVSLSSPDCEDDRLKYGSSCKDKGSLWDPNITVCNMDSEVEVNFTANHNSPTYEVILCEEEDEDECISHHVNLPVEEDDSRVSVRISVSSSENKKIFYQLIPSFPECGNDCRRRSQHLLLCAKKPGVIDLVVLVAGLFTALSLFIVILAVLYFKKRDAAERPHSNRQSTAEPSRFLRSSSSSSTFIMTTGQQIKKLEKAVSKVSQKVLDQEIQSCNRPLYTAANIHSSEHSSATDYQTRAYTMLDGRKEENFSKTVSRTSDRFIQ